MWWMFLVTITALMRGLISDRFMRLIDFGSGGMLTVWGIWMIVQA
jgi:threonine/homoserine/homoserine lactone efflux protein